jgi:hypothetical protein
VRVSMACRTVPTVVREVGRWDNPAHVYEELTLLLYKVRSACPLTFCQGGGGSLNAVGGGWVIGIGVTACSAQSGSTVCTHKTP